MKNYNKTAPTLSKDLIITPFNGIDYLIEHKTLNYQIHINKCVYNIISLIDGKKNIPEIAKTYNNSASQNISEESIHYLLYTKLSKFGIIQENEIFVKKRPKANYLKLSFELIPSKITISIANKMQFFFDWKLFNVLIIVLPIFVCSIIFFFNTEIINGLKSAISPMFIIYIFLFGFWTFIHEFGHASACQKYGVEPGGIGFGFYLFSPVLYSDVSQAWRLPRKERIIVNIAGIYFELIAASFFIIIYLIFQIELFLIVPCFLFINTLYNLNPLIKYDGYWILSDAIQIPNLHKESQKTLTKTLRSKNIKSLNSPKDYFLFFYAIVSGLTPYSLDTIYKSV
ncbi:MAG: hypothetical protein ACOCWG_02420 [bacterium]